MIDFHSHVLPGIDDGSKNVTESLRMLKSLAEQGVKTVVATPHFSANRESVEDFIARRNKAADELRAAATDGLPQILCGAEVRYYPGISRLDGIERLCIEGSRLLLIEMNMAKWTEYTLGELVSLAGRSGITVVLAHVERYMSFQTKEAMRRLYESGMVMQFNADFFFEFRTRCKAIAMLRRGEIHLIGSDCHNMTRRPPQIGKAYAAISKKLGDDFTMYMIEQSNKLLNKK